MSKYFSTVIFVFALQLCFGCSSQRVEQREQLYAEIGGHEGLENLVDAFVQRIVKDKVILPYFAKSSVKHFKQGFINHLCGLVNGPCKYNGDSMIDIHTGMNINEGDFNRVVELLIQAMEDVGIPYSSQNRILAKLAVFRAEIIKI
jgi:hemoglobin